MFNISKWFNHFQAPAVLMIDDLSDAYIDVYPESHKNDWGYMYDEDGSSFSFLKKELLDIYPHIKITFFTPYLKHNVINENSQFNYKKFALGERSGYTDFLKRLDEQGHEIAHHGSNHGEYTDKSIQTTVNNWTHEWALFEDVKTGVETTLTGVRNFKEICDINVVGGKYCGYITRENSQEIIDKCDFLYWCERPNFNAAEYNDDFFGKNEIISFPTTVSGNSFVRLSYITGNKQKDRKKRFLKYFQPLYNLLSYVKIYKHYKETNIISVQEHISPSTTSGIVQSANIISDIRSLHNIFRFLKKLSIWYANCEDIAKYIYTREHSEVIIEANTLNIIFTNKKNLKDTIISIVNDKVFALKKNNKVYKSIKNNGLYTVNLPIIDGENIFLIT